MPEHDISRFKKMLDNPAGSVPAELAALADVKIAEIEFGNLPEGIDCAKLASDFKEEFDAVAPYIKPFILQKYYAEPPSRGIKIMLDDQASYPAVMNAFVTALHYEMERVGITEFAQPLDIKASDVPRRGGPSIRGH